MNYRKSTTSIIVSIIITLMALATSNAIDRAKGTVDEGNYPLAEESFVYNPTGKIDPFESTFKPKPVPVGRKKKKAKKRIPSTPLEMIDLSQIRLTGIICAGSGNKAMVEEASGKGYVIAVGTYIGIHSGKVIEISNNYITVEEEVEDSSGNLTTQTTKMRIN